MIKHGIQQSTVKPKGIEITESKVFVASGIVPVHEEGTEEQTGFSGYKFNLTEYDKDEYVRVQAEKNQSLEDEMTNTQIALCEIYESVGV